jgi:hypothetical protein
MRAHFARFLDTDGIPDPDLADPYERRVPLVQFPALAGRLCRIRSFTDVLWPDFDKSSLEQAIADFRKPGTPVRRRDVGGALMGDWTPSGAQIFKSGAAADIIGDPDSRSGLAAVWSGGWGLAVACAAAAGVMAWEWGHISGFVKPMPCWSRSPPWRAWRCLSAMSGIALGVILAGAVFAAIVGQGRLEPPRQRCVWSRST